MVEWELVYIHINNIKQYVRSNIKREKEKAQTGPYNDTKNL